MNFKKAFRHIGASSALLSMVAALSACGGGGSVQSTSKGSDSVNLNTPGSLSISAGDLSFLSGTAESFPNKLSTLVWTVTPLDAVAGALLSVTQNKDCADSSQKTQTGSTGVSKSTWDCTATISAPANLTKDSTYNVSLTATDSKGNSSVSATKVTVTVIPGVTAKPTATLSAPSSVISADQITSTCQGGAGFVLKEGIYNYQWVSTPDIFADATITNKPTIKFIAPTVKIVTD